MSIGKILYYILYVPVLLATGIYYIFHFIDFMMEIAVDVMEDLLDQIKEF